MPDKGNKSSLTERFFSRSAKGSVSAVHLIHRGAVPLPLEGKDNAPPKIRLGFHSRARHFPHRGERSVAAPARRLKIRSFLRAHLYLPLIGEGGPLAVDEVRDSPERPTFAVSPTLSGVKAFPSRGRGTALAVDEVHPPKQKSCRLHGSFFINSYIISGVSIPSRARQTTIAWRAAAERRSR